MSITHITVARRLSFGFGAVLLMLAGMTALAIVELGALHDETTEIVDKDWTNAKLATAALDNARGSIARVFELTSDLTPDREAKALERLVANTQAFWAPLDQLEKLVYLPEGKALVAKAKASATHYVAAYTKVLDHLKQGHKEEAIQAAFGETYTALHVFAADLRAINELQQRLVEASGAHSEKTFENARQF